MKPLLKPLITVLFLQLPACGGGDETDSSTSGDSLGAGTSGEAGDGDTGTESGGETTTGGSSTGGSATGGSATGGSATGGSATGGGDVPSEPLLTDMRSFIFGHSLLNHATSLPETPNETTVPHWMAAFAEDSGYTYRADGQYGFLPQHSQLPPNPQWGFEEVEGVWNTDSGQSFADAQFNNVLLTAGNFVQYQPATAAYDGDNPEGNTPLSETLKIVDWVQLQDPNIDIYIYENWPDMASFLQSFPPTSEELSNYYDFTQGDFHAWWLAYQDEVQAARPAANVRMIPVGPIMMALLSGTLGEIPTTELYEDDAPHGRPTLYFLAALITYMGTYGAAPQLAAPPSSIHSEVSAHFEETVAFIWSELNAFEYEDGTSRVWQ